MLARAVEYVGILKSKDDNQWLDHIGIASKTKHVSLGHSKMPYYLPKSMLGLLRKSVLCGMAPSRFG